MPAPPAPRHPVPAHIPEHLREAFATTKGTGVPAHCPYRSGDAVQLHGYSGEMPGHRQTGFRGWVVASVGATVLTGITTCGAHWCEYWGRLEPDGRPVNLAHWCTCCQVQRCALREALHATQHASGQQLDLFASPS